MKILAFPFARAAFFVLLTVFVSCDNDDPGTSTSIVGEWNVVSRELFDCPDEANNGVVDCGTSTSHGDCGTWEFKSDGTYTVASAAGGTVTYQYETGPNAQIDLLSQQHLRTTSLHYQRQHARDHRRRLYDIMPS